MKKQSKIILAVVLFILVIVSVESPNSTQSIFGGFSGCSAQTIPMSPEGYVALKSHPCTNDNSCDVIITDIVDDMGVSLTSQEIDNIIEKANLHCFKTNRVNKVYDTPISTNTLTEKLNGNYCHFKENIVVYNYCTNNKRKQRDDCGSGSNLKETCTETQCVNSGGSWSFKDYPCVTDYRCDCPLNKRWSDAQNKCIG